MMTGPRADDLLQLFDEVAGLFHRLKAAAEEVHQEGDGSAARRGVMRSLARLGPRTVPQLAAERPVSRQHIQVIVNALEADGLVELIENPAHRRSSLVRLTRRGEKRLSEMAERERAMLGEVKWAATRTEIRAAAATLRVLKEQLGGARPDS